MKNWLRAKLSKLCNQLTSQLDLNYIGNQIPETQRFLSRLSVDHAKDESVYLTGFS